MMNLFVEIKIIVIMLTYLNDDKNNKKKLKINEVNGQPLIYLDREVIPDVDGVNFII